MRSLSKNKFWCHLSVRDGQRYTNRDIRQSRAIKVKSFRELVPLVARISNHNADHSLFYRGQSGDYKLASGASSVYPTIFRSPGGSLSKEELSSRYDKLEWCSEELLKILQKRKFDNIDKLKKFPELRWSILQHYGVCDTPLIDLTHSLRVAASFALNGTQSKGFILVFALPHPHGTITYSTEDELLNVRLLSAAPSKALRPHFQEGFLVGTFPATVDRKRPSLDLGVRLLAKIEIPKTGFWSNSFHAIPDEALYPVEDEIAIYCDSIIAKSR